MIFKYILASLLVILFSLGATSQNTEVEGKLFVGDLLPTGIDNSTFNKFSVADTDEVTTFFVRAKKDKSQVFIGNRGTGIAGLGFDAMNGDFRGNDYGTLYQYDDGRIELRNVGSNPIVISTANTEQVMITEQGDLMVMNSNRGLILKSPNKCWRVTIDDFGDFQKNEVVCP